MAPKDYVARGRAVKTPPPKNTNYKLIFSFVLVFAGALSFGYFLWMIKDNAPDTPVAQEKPEQEEALPVLEEEEWEFMRSLPFVTVEIEDVEQQVSDRLYVMQCGSFRKESQAQEMKARIAFEGLESQIRPSNGTNGLWYRVILGPYEAKRAAEKHRHTLRRIDITTCQIWGWNF